MRKNPRDKIQYIVANNVIAFTEKILSEYGLMQPPNEGLVYWGGVRSGFDVIVNAAVAPNTKSSSFRIETSPESNVQLIKILTEHNIVHIGQVHSHPSDWVEHSLGDDEWAAFKIKGLLSIVVPEYCMNGFLPFKNCGVHRFTGKRFIRLSDSYILKHFKIEVSKNTNLIDLR